MKILFVCTGNTCRSPMAEGIFRDMIKKSPFEGEFVCLSAGIAAKLGDPATENAIKAMAEFDIDISTHKAKRIKPECFDVWDVFFVMSDTHAYILEKAGIPPEKIYVPSHISDPFGLDVIEYKICRDKILNEIKIFLNKILAARSA